MSFIRCDRGSEPTDHHTLAMTLGPSNKYVHSAYEVADLDTVAAGGEYLLQRGYRRSWGIGRHIQGSQVFDYWRDPDGFLVEHYADGDKFGSRPGWAPMTASGSSGVRPRPPTSWVRRARDPRDGAGHPPRARQDGQRVRPEPARPAQGGDLMSIPSCAPSRRGGSHARRNGASDRHDGDQHPRPAERPTGAAGGARSTLRGRRGPAGPRRPAPDLPRHGAVPGRGADDQLRVRTCATRAWTRIRCR